MNIAALTLVVKWFAAVPPQLFERHNETGNVHRHSLSWLRVVAVLEAAHFHKFNRTCVWFSFYGGDSVPGRFVPEVLTQTLTSAH